MKATILGIVLLFFTACNDDKNQKVEEQVEQTNTQVAEKKLEFNRLLKFSLNIFNSDQKFEIQRKNKDNKDLEFNSEDKLVLFYFFTTWCPPCKAEIVHLNNLATKYEDRLKIIGVLLEDKDEKELNDFIKEQKINFDIATGDNNYTFLKVLGDINGIPYILLYDQNGKNINNYLGAVYEEMIDIDIQKVMR